MDDDLKTLNSLISDVVDLRHAASLLEWDQRVYMPPAGAAVHGEMLGTIRKLAHEKLTSGAVGRVLDALKARLNDLDPDSDAARLVRVTARDYDKATRVPPDFVAEEAQVLAAAHEAWREARARSEFSLFQPHLERVIDLKRRYVTFFPPAESPYDILLDDFEPGIKTAEIQALFSVLRPRQVALIRAIGDRPQVDNAFLHLVYPEKDLWDFASDVVTRLGFDWTRGRLDKSAHPFTAGPDTDDVRITTRFEERQPFMLLFAALHETGHALYDQGVSRTWNRTLLEGGVSLGVHESQSRLWENLVGRALPFWQHFYPRLQQRFPSQLGGISLQQFYHGINKVQPSLIRVEADEATYNLHVMLRVEMEIAMLDGAVAVKDLPELWNTRVREYLGIVPTDDPTGILQDMHWSIGAIGYFATYTLGNLISVQLWERFEGINPDRDDEIRHGEFASLLSWLRDGIHRHGRKYQPWEVVERAAGSRIDPAPYLRYLDGKYGEIYGL